MDDSTKTQWQQNFVRNFVSKNSRDRILFELTSAKKRSQFVKRLNHQAFDFLTDAAMTEIPPKTDDGYDFVVAHLDVSGSDDALIISSYPETDNTTMSFKDAFSEVYYNSGLASLILLDSGSKLYLQTEQVDGAPGRYVGRISK